ncbi:TerB family tellurite resistance protein [Nibrella saemangeumensis]
MISPDMSMGLGSIVFALAKADGSVQQDEIQAVREALSRERHGDVALHTFFIQTNCGETAEDAYAFGMRKLRYTSAKLENATKKYLLDVVCQVAGAHKAISVQEETLIDQFAQDLKQL